MSMWVREAWASADLVADGCVTDSIRNVVYRADMGVLNFELCDCGLDEGIAHVRRRGSPAAVDTTYWPGPADKLADGSPAYRWRPSIHMPRWASRITLEITDVRCQRLQDITEEDARAEGALHARALAEANGATTTDDVPVARRAFANLWDDINGAGAWAANPWAWALTFTRVDEVRRA